MGSADYLRAELYTAAEHEMVVTLDDFMRRRSKIDLVVRDEDIDGSDGLPRSPASSSAPTPSGGWPTTARPRAAAPPNTTDRMLTGWPEATRRCGREGRVMTTTASPGSTPSVRELIAELASTEDALRGRHGRGLSDGDLRLVRRQAAVVRELRRRRTPAALIRSPSLGTPARAGLLART